MPTRLVRLVVCGACELAWVCALWMWETFIHLYLDNNGPHCVGKDNGAGRETYYAAQHIISDYTVSVCGRHILSVLSVNTWRMTEARMFCCWDEWHKIHSNNIEPVSKWTVISNSGINVTDERADFTANVHLLLLSFSYTSTTGWRPPLPSGLLPSWMQPSQHVGTVTLLRTCVTAPSCSSPFTCSLHVQRAAPLEKVAVKYSETDSRISIFYDLHLLNLFALPPLKSNCIVSVGSRGATKLTMIDVCSGMRGVNKNKPPHSELGPIVLSLLSGQKSTANK